MVAVSLSARVRVGSVRSMGSSCSLVFPEGGTGRGGLLVTLDTPEDLRALTLGTTGRLGGDGFSPAFEST